MVQVEKCFLGCLSIGSSGESTDGTQVVLTEGAASRATHGWSQEAVYDVRKLRTMIVMYIADPASVPCGLPSSLRDPKASHQPGVSCQLAWIW